MTTSLDIAKAYFRAWTSNDIDTALALMADDIVIDAPAGRLEGKDAVRAFIAPFASMLLETTLLAAYGDDDAAVVVYDTRTPLVASGHAAELVTVRGGLIVHDRFIFDRQPYTEARAAASGT